jgi:hypothetical protein
MKDCERGAGQAMLCRDHLRSGWEEDIFTIREGYRSAVDPMVTLAKKHFFKDIFFSKELGKKSTLR